MRQPTATTTELCFSGWQAGIALSRGWIRRNEYLFWGKFPTSPFQARHRIRRDAFQPTKDGCFWHKNLRFAWNEERRIDCMWAGLGDLSGWIWIRRPLQRLGPRARTCNSCSNSGSSGSAPVLVSPSQSTSDARLQNEDADLGPLTGCSTCRTRKASYTPTSLLNPSNNFAAGQV